MDFQGYRDTSDNMDKGPEPINIKPEQNADLDMKVPTPLCVVKLRTPGHNSPGNPDSTGMHLCKN